MTLFGKICSTRTPLMYAGFCLSTALTPVWAATNVPVTPVPGYVAPVVQTDVAPYVDDTRGVYVPEHTQLRQKTGLELASWNQSMPGEKPLYAQKGGQGYEKALNTVADGVPDTSRELDRISNDPGLLAGGKVSSDAALYAQDAYAGDGTKGLNGQQVALNMTAKPGGKKDLSNYPSLATANAQARPVDMSAAPVPAVQGNTASARSDGGQELAVGQASARGELDLQHSVVRLKEERVSVRRALQRMLDQVGGGSWTVVWDLDEVNAGLPDMEISIYAEEPFIKVMNALLARLQTRSGQPIRVIKYDKTQRLVITDRTGGDTKSASIGTGGKGGADVAVTETVMKESTVSLHYDEVPLVDALENIVNQAGKGQWRLRMYAGTDQVLKPAHVEEPFGVALERILKVFNLRYEVFPGGKLIVVTSGSSFGFRGVE